MTDSQTSAVELCAMVESVFSVDGVLARADRITSPREGQLAMAQAVAHAMGAEEVLVAEAGTGVGKTYAYLVPALLSGERVLLSTATKALQDTRCFTRYSPPCAGAGGSRACGVAQGRSSYLCLHRLGMARHAVGGESPQQIRVLAKIEEWSRSTRSAATCRSSRAWTTGRPSFPGSLQRAKTAWRLLPQCQRTAT